MDVHLPLTNSDASHRGKIHHHQAGPPGLGCMNTCQHVVFRGPITSVSQVSSLLETKSFHVFECRPVPVLADTQFLLVTQTPVHETSSTSTSGFSLLSGVCCSRCRTHMSSGPFDQHLLGGLGVQLPIVLFIEGH